MCRRRSRVIWELSHIIPLPIDAEDDDDTHWVPNARLSSYLQRMAPRHVMVVADSCYSGTLVRSAPIREQARGDRAAWLARLAEKRARTALVSGGLEPVVDGGSDGHSVFASAFLKSLRDNDDVLEGQTLFREVRRQVVLNADQTPEYSDMRKAGHEGGDFLFVPVGLSQPKPAAASPAAAPARRSGPDRELVFWQTIADSKDPEDFRDYIVTYLEGEFVSLAQRRIRALEKREARAPARAPAPVAAPVATPAPVPAPKPRAVPKPNAAPQPKAPPVQTANVTPKRPVSAAPASGPWRVTVDAGGFYDGHLGRMKRPSRCATATSSNG